MTRISPNLSDKETEQSVECTDCGLIQQLPPRRKGHDRVCSRCHASFGDGGTGSREYLLAMAATLLIILVACNLSPLFGVDIKGNISSITLPTAPAGLAERGMRFLSYVVFALLVLVPLIRLSMQALVFYCLWSDTKPHWLGKMFRWVGELTPWAMLEIFLIGIFVALSKLRAYALISFYPGVYLLGAFTLTIGILYSHYDRRMTWNQIMSPKILSDNRPGITCLHCDLLQTDQKMCVRCDAPLHHRKPNSLSRTWALVAASLMLYIPANLYPMLIVINLGNEKRSTILDGIREMWTPADWPFAIIIFAASIVVPLFKLTGLLAFLLALHFRHTRYVSHFTRLYRVFDFIGRWSMLDVFVASMLCTVVAFDDLTSILPGLAIMPFAAVVVLTMFAVSSFDPRLLWDMIEEEHG